MSIVSQPPVTQNPLDATKPIRKRLRELNTKAYYLLVALTFLYYHGNPTRSLKAALILTALVAVLPVQDLSDLLDWLGWLKSGRSLLIAKCFKAALLTAALVFTIWWVWHAAQSPAPVQASKPAIQAPERAAWLHWLNSNAGAIQAMSTVVLTGITTAYVFLTRASVKAAERQANAGIRQAEAAEKTLAFTRQQIEDQLRLGPQIVLHAIAETQVLVGYWTSAAASFATQADAQSLSKTPIDGAIDHATRLSPGCAQFLVQARGHLRTAQHEIENMQRAALTVHKMNASSKAIAFLNHASDSLQNAQQAAVKQIEENSGGHTLPDPAL